MGKVGAVLAPRARAAGHELVATRGRADAVVDFTAPDAVVAEHPARARRRRAVRRRHERLGPADVDGAARERGVAVFFAPNFAIGAVLMMRFAAEAAALPDARRDRRAAPRDEARRAVGHGEGDRAAMRGDVPIHSVRLPGLVAHQEVILGGPGQTLTIRHDTTSREAFVPGVLLALEKLRELPPGVTVGLDALL